MSDSPHPAPRFRPSRGIGVGHWILWEADWEDYPIDPFLLKWICGDLYLVLAKWDLSPLEREVAKAISK